METVNKAQPFPSPSLLFVSTFRDQAVFDRQKKKKKKQQKKSVVVLGSVPCHFYISKCSASIQIPHIQTVLTKHIEDAALGHKI